MKFKKVKYVYFQDDLETVINLQTSSLPPIYPLWFSVSTTQKNSADLLPFLFTAKQYVNFFILFMWLFFTQKKCASAFATQRNPFPLCMRSEYNTIIHTCNTCNVVYFGASTLLIITHVFELFFGETNFTTNQIDEFLEQ